MGADSRERSWTPPILVLGLLVAGLWSVVAHGETLKAVWEVLTGHRIEVAGAPVAANHPRLSEHNIEWVETQPPQVQAEFLLSSAINHLEGATDLIAQHVDEWRGQLMRTPEWQQLEMTALYSSDLRVRAAAIEIDLAVHGLQKTDEVATRMIEQANEDEAARTWSVWTLGMLANRGVQAERIHEVLVEYTYDSSEETRLWAVEGLAHIGSDETIPEFIRVLGTDPSMKVRERAGCSLAKSGMLTRVQRLKAVPGLIDLADDPSLESVPRKWVYQALREITNVALPDDPDEWRYRHSTEGWGGDDTEPWRVLGNS